MATVERGFFGTTCIRAILNLLSNTICPVPDCNICLESYSAHMHFLYYHSELTASIEEIIGACVHCSDSIYLWSITIVLNLFGMHILNHIFHFLFPVPVKPRANKHFDFNGYFLLWRCSCGLGTRLLQ